MSKANLDALKPYVRKSILRGDFLLSVNELSDVWIYLRHMNVEEVREIIRDILVDFWRNFLVKRDGDFVLLTLEHIGEYSEDEIPTALIGEEVVEWLDTPRLHSEKLLIDPESFEFFLEETPEGNIGVLFVALSLHIDLLKEVVKQLRASGYTILGVLAILEREKISGPEIRNNLQSELIPLLVYEEERGKLYTVTEIDEEPYSAYHQFFS